jgi:hypothetical protein
LIQTPDFLKNPLLDLTDDLTLQIQLEQTNLLLQYKIDGESIRFDDKILVVKGALSEHSIVLQRSGDCDKGDSGWCIRCAEDEEEHDDPSDYESIYAYQLLKLRKPVMKALSLPYEYIVVFEGEDLKAIINEDDENLIQLG